MESTSLRSSRSTSKKGLIIGSLVAGLFFVGVTAAFAGGSKKKKKKKVDPVVDEPAPDEEPAPDPKKPDPKPDAPPDPNALKFDLSTNWGGIPMGLRIWLARGELASGIPGLARALAVKWWQAFRAGKPYVTPAEAAKIAAANPELARYFINKGDAGASKKLLDNAIAKGWPKPADYATFATGSWGFGDILGGNFPYAGILTEGKAALPYLNLPGKALMQSYQGQLGAAISMIRNIIVAPNYSVLDGGPNAAGDSLQTWGNIFSAYAGLDAYIKGNQQALDAKARYLERAIEIGIDLAKVAYPWPPGKVFKHPPWDFGDVNKLLTAYAAKPVMDTTNGQVLNEDDPPKDEPKNEPGPDMSSETMDLGQNISATVYRGGGIAAADKAPLVILLHGRGGDAQQLVSSVDTSYPARFAFLDGPIKDGEGFEWFTAASNAPDAELAPAIASAAKVVEQAGAKLTAKYPTTDIYVIGYSQGAAIAYRLAAMDVAKGVLAIAGYLPKSLGPQVPIKVHLYATHGTADKAVSFARGKAAFDLFPLYTDSPVWTPVDGGDHGLASLRTTVKLLTDVMLP